MSKIDVLKESLQFQSLIKESGNTSIIKDEYLIPDTNPDVEEILMVEANPKIISKEIIGDKIIVEGKVEYNIIYIPREDNMMLSSVKYYEKFTNSLEINDNEHKIICEAGCKLEHIESKVMNERKIEIESVIKVSFEVYKELEFEIVNNIEASGGIQVLRNVENFNRLVMNNDIDLLNKSMIRVSMDKPQVYKVLNCSAILHKKEVKLAEDKVYLACYCKLDILYSGEDSKEILCLHDDVYISKEEEVVGVMPEMLPYVNFDIENIDLSIEEDDLGEARIINTEFLVKCKMKVFTDESIDIIEDAYSTKFPVELSKEDHEVALVHSIKSIESIIKDNLYIKEGDLKPESIQAVSANVVVRDKIISDNKINIEGVINTKVLYKSSSEEKGFGTLAGDIPFTITLDVNGITNNMKSIVKCDLDSIEAAIEANTIAIKATLVALTKVTYDINKSFIANIIEGNSQMQKNTSSITIYIIGKGESLWNLAKKFNTTVDELIKINSIEEPEMDLEGEKLIIPGRAVF